MYKQHYPKALYFGMGRKREARRENIYENFNKLLPPNPSRERSRLNTSNTLSHFSNRYMSSYALGY